MKRYFPEHKVVAGLFHVIETLFAVQIREDKTSTWHPDVKFFRVERNAELVGQFYLDLYARAAKQGGAWMDDARARCRKTAKCKHLWSISPVTSMRPSSSMVYANPQLSRMTK